MVVQGNDVRDVSLGTENRSAIDLVDYVSDFLNRPPGVANTAFVCCSRCLPPLLLLLHLLLPLLLKLSRSFNPVATQHFWFLAALSSPVPCSVEVDLWQATRCRVDVWKEGNIDTIICMTCRSKFKILYYSLARALDHADREVGWPRVWETRQLQTALEMLKGQIASEDYIYYAGYESIR